MGYNDAGSITNCYSTGDASGDARSGGFVGENEATISDCYSTGSATGGNRVGGFAAYNYVGGSIINCYSTGSASGTGNVGGFVGEDIATITSCYWDIETSGTVTSDGGVGKTTAEMKQQSTFTGWDFGSTWSIIEDVTYPDLRGMPEETICWSGQLDTVGGVASQINKIKLLTPYIILGGLIVALSTIYVIKRR